MSVRFGFKRVSARKQREALASAVLVSQTTEAALLGLLNLSFWGRMKWLLFGKP